MSDQIWAKAQKAHINIDEETKNSLIQQGKNEARASFMERIKKITT